MCADDAATTSISVSTPTGALGPPSATPRIPSIPAIQPIAPFDLLGLLKQIETNYINAALEQTGGNRQAAARLLGLRRTTLVEKLRRRAAGDRTAHAGD